MTGLETFKELLGSSEYYGGYAERSGILIFDGDVIETIELVICETDTYETIAVFCASDESFIDIVSKTKVARMRPR